jgi:hypothetical protein
MPPSPVSSPLPLAPAPVSLPLGVDRVDLCNMMPPPSMVQMETDLDRAVMVTVTAGDRREISLDVAARAIYEQLVLPPYSFSIRAFKPADFLVLCDTMDVHDTLVLAGSVSMARCALSLAPWSRQVGAFLWDTPFLAQLDIRDIPAHAWAERTTINLLEGCGIMDAVDPATANQNDMSVFRVDVWTHDVASIPTVRWLAVPELRHRNRLEVSIGRRRPRANSLTVLWYRIRFEVRSWIVGTVPSPGSSDNAGGDGAGAAGSAREGDGAGGVAGHARRHRRCRRGHEGIVAVQLATCMSKRTSP